ncbi:unnamed protein product [Didymodactylos carnosus]|uniref:Uncharacterized protein n=1 Tax=Didymodactylos carnosus TaxID=1234261 RepID=A0A8S2E4C6_9BILA|nr:unnamed protein product [Didymodactylos carnosus]CAF3830176.1 unnamed protein product [Didymodactylos carnosus]
MTMERGSSVFDKSVYLHALATSDLVLLNTSKVIDAPMQELLKYAMFVYSSFRIVIIWETETNIHFVRDMATENQDEFNAAKESIERAMLEYFVDDSAKIGFTCVLEQLIHMTLASALHRNEDNWMIILTDLRRHIPDNITEYSQKAPPNHKRIGPCG